jgi:peptidoglycan/LPS O-acetylase OafA/YrhL
MLHGVVPNEALHHSAEAILPPAWSISVEWQFYLLAPLLFAFATRPNWKATLVMALLIALRVLHDAGRLGMLFPGLPRALTFDMNAFLPLKLEFFAVGAASYALWRWLTRRASLRVPSWVYVALLLAVLASGLWSPALALWMMAFALIVRSNFGTHSRIAHASAGLLNRPMAQFLGRISYSVYLLHLPVIVLVRYLSRADSPGSASIQFQIVLVIASLGLTILGAWLLHVTVEKPMIQLGKRLTHRWKIQSSPATAVSAATHG